MLRHRFFRLSISLSSFCLGAWWLHAHTDETVTLPLPDILWAGKASQGNEESGKWSGKIQGVREEKPFLMCHREGRRGDIPTSLSLHDDTQLLQSCPPDQIHALVHAHMNLWREDQDNTKNKTEWRNEVKSNLFLFYFYSFSPQTKKQKTQTAQPKANKYPISHFSQFNCCLSVVF